MQPTAPSTSNRSPVATGHDGPGVRIPPPVYFILSFLVGWALQARVPLPWVGQPIAWSVGGALLAVGLLINATGVATLLRGHGTLSTAAPSAALVTSGPYRFSRNPLYLGLVFLYSGLAALFGIVWALPLLIPLVIYTQIAAIVPEERYLERAFGDAYRAYKARVRRWI